jgi:hypothetical protein
MRVDFMIIGAQKCGTTSLAGQLAQHPQVCFCRNKEPGYFHQTEDWQAGLEQYHALYAPRPGQLCGEASTFYTFYPEWRSTHKRLYAYNPNLKLIYIMRQPVERVISHYAHDLVRHSVQGPPEATVFKDPAYVNRSRYAVQLRPYLELFGRGNVLLLLFEEYIRNQQLSLCEIADFLQLDPAGFDQTGDVHAHSSVGKEQIRYAWLRKLTTSSAFDLARTYLPPSIRRPIRRLLSDQLDEKPVFSSELKCELWRLLADDVVSVEQWLGRPLPIWRKGYDE